MPTPRPSTRRRKPGVATTYSQRRLLLHSESVPEIADNILNTQASNLGVEPLGQVTENLNNHHEPGLSDTLPKEKVELPEQEKENSFTPTYITNPRRTQHRKFVWNKLDEHDEKISDFQLKKPITALQYLKELRKRQDYEFCGKIQQTLLNSVRVPKCMTFFEFKSGLKCKFTIENISGFNLTYSMKSSSLAKFMVISSIGWIPPHTKVVIEIKTQRDRIIDFANIASEKFVVYAAPVFIEEQLEQKKLKIYWQAFGSELFPYVNAERHEIKTIIPKNTEKYCTLDLIGIERQHKKENIEHNFEPADPDTFRNIWELNGNSWVRNLMTDCHYREFLQYGPGNTINEKCEYSKKVILTLTAGGLILLGTLLLFGLLTNVQTLPFGILELRQFFSGLMSNSRREESSFFGSLRASYRSAEYFIYKLGCIPSYGWTWWNWIRS